ncbi:hypothetical protein PGT21_034693 [Puccinia graminis f. sp. tritici]|uniref:Uncharacterized protein n=1 Tax=Puccinia graminis f. sp. tritici TaxID=56615 RepID=A0A5B0MWR9_PUCGR|nr:hypothetical protein PGT21_034693 [Puccinia graminis f. sp. tritici]
MKQGAQIVQTGILGFSIYLSNGHTNKIHPAQLSLLFIGRLLLKNTLRDFLRIFRSGDFTTNFCIFERRCFIVVDHRKNPRNDVIKNDWYVAAHILGFLATVSCNKVFHKKRSLIMVMSMSDLIQGDVNDPSTQFEGVRDQLIPLIDSPNHTSPVANQEIDPANLFGPLSTADTTMNDTVISSLDCAINKTCTDLQSKLNLDPEHLSIALLTSTCDPEARHANMIFAMAAYHQLSVQSNMSLAANHLYDNRFKDFVRTQARMILLNPTLEAYSNNPHLNGALPKTLYYLTLDAVDQQSSATEWKEDHLASKQLQDDPVALENYREAVGELLKHQRSNFRTLLLANILKTKRITIKGPVPNRHEMLTSIYQDLPPKGEKLTATQIQAQVNGNWAMRIRTSYA